ncbi:HAD-IA family hydrolase [Sulfobacillus harzensis]|uniref:HAD-IA family hydrolase n=1 Tax=Sulfobacillus harzensis TaxID=2729629 RepID=UPI0030842358
MWQFLFDFDGTILDTTDLILKSFAHTFETGLGESISREELLVHFGRPLAEQFRIMRPALSDAEIERLVAIYREHNEITHDELVSIVPGADAGLRRLKALGFPLGIVTSKRLNMTEQGLKGAGLFDLFDVIVHMDSTPNHKPHPEPVQHALKIMGGAPERAAYVGDSPYDMAAGRAAGVRTLGLIYNTFSEPVLREAGADVIAHDWEQVVETLLGWAKSNQ